MTETGLDFWSRRKAKVAEEALAEAEQPAEPTAELSDEEVLAALDLPDPDTLELGDDIKGFMAKAVPDHLRRKALRRLWRLNPTLANVDGLVDYGEDFTDSATVIEGMQTAYQVGKGMFAHVQEMARQAEALAEELTDEEEDAPEVEDTTKVVVAAAEEPVEIEEEAQPEPRRRMRFSYGSETMPA
ncbi:DUF3306 domain-containing protein [Cognatiyoonia sp. IB215182]|uniref:DUF3306 domain-containing protein n=1 Tax=Cognatiyoonia sp. IB215182 TaxID=3097353 RepID=UPI002A1720A0|nr:DUF3306 domain-containing protein [Cognatiyoonia sp. IB215182]MDX8352407.1 DUF3306 domain-containing protein [Cognatiyoonia sp. IB215182]